MRVLSFDIGTKNLAMCALEFAGDETTNDNGEKNKRTSGEDGDKGRDDDSEKNSDSNISIKLLFWSVVSVENNNENENENENKNENENESKNDNDNVGADGGDIGNVGKKKTRAPAARSLPASDVIRNTLHMLAKEFGGLGSSPRRHPPWDRILLENQLGLKNTRMKMIQTAIHSFFCLQSPEAVIENVNPSMKIRYAEKILSREHTKNMSYRKRKDIVEEATMQMLGEEATCRFLKGNKKKDDMCDSFMQALAKCDLSAHAIEQKILC